MFVRIPQFRNRVHKLIHTDVSPYKTMPFNDEPINKLVRFYRIIIMPMTRVSNDLGKRYLIKDYC